MRPAAYRRFRQWEGALPSRLHVNVPAGVQEQVVAARNRYHRLGQHSRTLEMIRTRIDREPVEKKELERILGEMGLPGGFDIPQITRRPNYNALSYYQLSKRARRQYLFREEFMFEVANGVVVETPQLGHATYLFAKPRNIESFLVSYTRVSKEEIRRNRENVAARLGFLVRIVHGVNPRAWVKELRMHLGEAGDCAEAGA